jgi:hypothetical protein
VSPPCHCSKAAPSSRGIATSFSCTRSPFPVWIGLIGGTPAKHWQSTASCATAISAERVSSVSPTSALLSLPIHIRWPGAMLTCSSLATLLSPHRARAVGTRHSQGRPGCATIPRAAGRLCRAPSWYAGSSWVARPLAQGAVVFVTVSDMADHDWSLISRSWYVTAYFFPPRPDTPNRVLRRSWPRRSRILGRAPNSSTVFLPRASRTISYFTVYTPVPAIARFRATSGTGDYQSRVQRCTHRH